MPGVVGSPSPVCQMPPPPFWNQGVARFGSAFDDWKPQVPLFPQSAVAKHSLPGDGPPEQTPPPLYSHTGLGFTPVGLLNAERSGNQPPSLLSKFQGTRLPHLPAAPQSKSTLQAAPRGPTPNTPHVPPAPQSVLLTQVFPGVGPPPQIPTQPTTMPLSR